MDIQKLLELNARLMAENYELRDENKKLRSNSIPVRKEYRIGDLAAILKNVTEGQL